MGQRGTAQDVTLKQCSFSLPSSLCYAAKATHTHTHTHTVVISDLLLLERLNSNAAPPIYFAVKQEKPFNEMDKGKQLF